MSQRVSVVISNYNYAAFVRDAVESALDQTCPPHEIIVVDDGSTDDSVGVLKTLPVRLIEQANAGQAAGFETGVRAATGDIICLLDSDDGWLPTKIETVIRAFANDPDCVWVAHKLVLVDENKNNLGATAPAFKGTQRVPPSPAAIAERILNTGTTLSFRARFADGIFPLPQVRYDADAFLFAKLGSRHPGWLIDEVLGFYRRHSGQQFRAADVLSSLDRHVKITTMLAHELGRKEPVVNAKHRLILASARNEPRTRHVLAGIGALVRLLPNPKLMVRQAVSLGFAAIAPQRWLRRHLKAWAE